jgi:hypothetical protein
VHRASLLSPEAEAAMAPGEARRSLPRLIASAAAIAAILVLGGLFWTALTSFVAAWSSAVSSLPQAASADRTEHFLTPAPPSFNPANPIRVTPTSAPPMPTPAPAPTVQPSATPEATPQPTVEPTPTSSERAPWVLLPQPAPGARVASGPLQLEARGRGDAPITDIRLELDGRSLPVSVEQRSDVIWRGVTSVEVSSGRHSVKALVVDAQGRTGSYGWTFEAGG